MVLLWTTLFLSEREKELIKLKENFNNNFKDEFTKDYLSNFSLVTVILHYSSKNELNSFLKTENQSPSNLDEKKQPESCLIE